ncbi:MAG: polyphosphate kinase 1 [Gammaproteobacteria bacterium]|nr:polyphosphate kinase 1 [Gammaproteobacteria bacterium]MBU1601893.1 polyphosphate kinase 1 [Gammaproteobacteria bacterium]MBU2432265.1 polyphosphate kinase 1 [Gammaproteobacteria bacterium]MBU2450342.1 polyphosphate kinase 1 [Gammaproteobacteria bacterium]
MPHPLPKPRFPTENYLNRELGLLAFNRRVLAQAEDERMPLLERLRFLCIVSSNLDEFFEIRMAGLKEQVKAHATVVTTDGKTAQEAFRLVSAEAHAIVTEQYQHLNDIILPALANEGIRFLRRVTWNEAQREWIRNYFLREMVPVLTPIGLDPSHPFPKVLNKSLNFAIELEGKDAFGRSSNAAIVQAPRVLPRVIQLPEELAGCAYGFVFLSSILHEFVGELFTGMTVLGCYQFRATRNSDLFVDEEEVTNLRTKLQGELPQRHFGNAVRLEVANNCSEAMTEFLLAQFALKPADLYRVNGPVNLVRLMQVPDWVDRPDMKFRPFVPGLPKVVGKGVNIFDTIRKADVLLHHPYQSFAPVIEFLSQAATDPAVVAIKMTVYRTGTDSVLMESLIRAAQNGKEVTVVVELMARFDEEANISWATKLEQVGAHVVYGVVGYKTHAKALLIVRREDGGLKRYAHLGTGNYHPRTARLYSDFGLMTANEEITNDVSEVFKQLTGLGKARTLKHLWQAPFTLQPNVVAGILAEAETARAGGKARIVAKMNSLVEPEVIDALYQASQAGVEIDLIVRGVCTLRPGVPGLSDKIRVRSIIGRFLEHHRIFYFLAGGKETVYLSSADWMDRNFFKRIELAFPILDPKLKKRVITEGLKFYLADNQQGWDMNSLGIYHRRRSSRSKPHNAQGELMVTLGSA